MGAAPAPSSSSVPPGSGSPPSPEPPQALGNGSSRPGACWCLGQGEAPPSGAAPREHTGQHSPRVRIWTLPGEVPEPAGTTAQLSSSSKAPQIQAKNKWALSISFLVLGVMCSVLREEQSVLLKGKYSRSTPSPSGADTAHLTPSPMHKPQGNQEAFCPIAQHSCWGSLQLSAFLGLQNEPPCRCTHGGTPQGSAKPLTGGVYSPCCRQLLSPILTLQG